MAFDKYRFLCPLRLPAQSTGLPTLKSEIASQPKHVSFGFLRVDQMIPILLGAGHR